jgi:hypothetical protein
MPKVKCSVSFVMVSVTKACAFGSNVCTPSICAALTDAMASIMAARPLN